MIQILVTHYQAHQAAIRAIRDEVFVREQQVPPDLEFDGLDAGACHALALAGDKPVGTGRLLAEGRIGRIAVLPDHRHQGIATRMLEALIDEARSRGSARVWLASQCQATRLYQKIGFESEGEVYLEAGIDHIRMSRSL